MKKLVFLFAMVFAVSMAMGQTAVINQSNTNAGGAGDNIADVSQTGMNLVKIDQVQNIQGTPGGTGTVTATVEQKGGKDNTVKISQTHNGTKNGGVSPLTVYAKQIGGKENLITQIQEAGGGNWGNVAFSAIQEGNNNTAYQRSFSDAGNDNGDIKQKGDYNDATQKWYGTNYREGGPNGELFIEQDGKRNEATQTFLAGTSFSSGTFNRGVAQITQKGDDNVANQTQQGAGNVQFVRQFGDDNVANLSAYGNYNMADVLQKGDDGEVKIVQKQVELGAAAEGAQTDGNSVMISQDGDDSEADIYQDGLRNIVEGLGGTGTYAVNNNGAYLKVKQVGSDHLVQSRQLVAGSASINQMGINNTAIVNQY